MPEIIKSNALTETLLTSCTTAPADTIINTEILKQAQNDVSKAKNSSRLYNEHEALIHSNNVFTIFLDLAFAFLLFRLTTIIPATITNISNSLMSFLGVLIPTLITIVKNVHEQDNFFGNESFLYSLYLSMRVVLIFGLVWTGPSVYNSSMDTIFPFFTFLIAVRVFSMIAHCIALIFFCDKKNVHVPLIHEIISICGYSCCIGLTSRLGYRVNYIYYTWAAATALDFLMLISNHYFKIFLPIQKKETTLEISGYLDVSYRIKIIGMGIICIAIFHLFDKRIGVGYPEIETSVAYSIFSFVIGCIGLITVISLMKIYIQSSANNDASLGDFSLNMFHRKSNVISYILHLALIPSLLVTFVSLQMSLLQLYQNNYELAPAGIYRQFSLNVSNYNLGIWSSLPIPTEIAQKSYLGQWVSSQNISTALLPPGVFEYSLNSTGTSHILFAKEIPDQIFSASLSLSLIIMTCIEISAFLLDIYLNESRKVDFKAIFQSIRFSVSFTSRVILIGALIILSTVNIQMIGRIICIGILILIQSLVEDIFKLKKRSM